MDTNTRKVTPLICVGQARAGTTSLYHLISNNPDFFTTPTKELNYLLSLATMGSTTLPLRSVFGQSSDSGKASFFNNIFSPQWRIMRDVLPESPVDLPEQYLCMLEAQARLVFMPHTLENYLDLIRCAPGNSIFTDISPEYFLLGDRFLDGIKENLSEARILIRLRDPYDRFLSQISMADNDTLSHILSLSVDEFDTELRHGTANSGLNHAIRHSLADKTVHRWKRHFRHVLVQRDFDMRRTMQEIVDFCGLQNVQSTQYHAHVNESNRLLIDYDGMLGPRKEVLQEFLRDVCKVYYSMHS
jgi:hypothetical protein